VFQIPIRSWDELLTACGGRMELGYASALGMVILALYAVFAAMYLRLRRPA